MIDQFFLHFVHLILIEDFPTDVALGPIITSAMVGRLALIADKDLFVAVNFAKTDGTVAHFIRLKNLGVKMPKFIAVSGPNGVGKTTFIGRLK